jgi:Transcriptional regulatory protein, C terminal
MAGDDYPGPHIVGRGGRGTQGWVWVAPGIGQSTPGDLPEEPPLGQHDLAAKEYDPVSVATVEDESAQRSTNESGLRTPEEVPANPRVRVNVIGPVEVESWLEPPTRHKVTEALCFLALHRRRPTTMEELQIALSRDGDGAPETSAKSVRTYMSELRRALGTEHVPSARGAGYRLAGTVTTDWDVFQSRVSVRSTDIDDELQALIDALNLVRGRPFAGTDYAWVHSELLVSEMEVAISDAARRLREVALAADRGYEAMVYFAGRRGALACPYDIGLWEMAMEGAAVWDRDALVKTWRDAQATLGDDAATLRPLAERLGLN